MAAEWVLILLLLILIALVFHISLLRKILFKLSDFETLIEQKSPKSQMMPYPQYAKAESAETLDVPHSDEEEIAAAITAALVAYENDK